MRLFGYDLVKRQNAAPPYNNGGSVLLSQTPYNSRTRTIRSDYENAFAPISAIVDEVVKRNVHLVSPTDPDVDVSANTPLWYALTQPHDRMDWLAFLGLLVSGFMALPELSLLLWHIDANGVIIAGAPEGGFTLETIAGFTVLPRGTRGINGQGQEEWRIFSQKYGQQVFGRDSVITLKYSLLPDDGFTGVSPGSSSAQEAAIRDSLNQYERAFFANGATPSLIVTIYARNNAEYEAIRAAYEASNRGPGKQGGVVYQSVIDTPIAGTSNPHIEVTPVGSVNGTLAINDIVSFTSATITSNYGVSPITFGDATTTTYQNQQLVDRNFYKRCEAVMLRLFSAFERELARITHTYVPLLPFKFAWTISNIELTDELKTQAETNMARVNALKALVDSGASVADAALALGLPEEWQKLTLEPSTLGGLFGNGATPTILLQSNPQVQLEASNARRDPVAARQPDALSRVREILLDIADHRVDLALGRVDNAAIRASEEAYVNEIVDILNDLADRGGVTAARQLAQEIKGFRVNTHYEMSVEAFQTIRKRAENVIDNYSHLLDSEIERMSAANPDTWTNDFTVALTTGAIAARINAIVTAETKYAFQSGQYDSAVKVQNDWRLEEPGGYVVKTWHATGAQPCEFCATMEGVQAGIEDSFTPGGLIHTHGAGAEDNVTLVLDTDYDDGTFPDAHVNCECTFGFTAEVRD